MSGTFVNTHTKKHQKTRFVNKQGLTKKNLSLAQGNELYATALKPLGGGQFLIKLFPDSVEGIGQLRGKMLSGKKFNYIENGDIVKVTFVEMNAKNTRFYQIELKYSKTEVEQLKELGHLKFIDNTNNDNKNKDTFIIGTQNKEEDNIIINDLFIMGI
jgi:translation initiation factor IF-1